MVHFLYFHYFNKFFRFFVGCKNITLDLKYIFDSAYLVVFILTQVIKIKNVDTSCNLQFMLIAVITSWLIYYGNITIYVKHLIIN